MSSYITDDKSKIPYNVDQKRERIRFKLGDKNVERSYKKAGIDQVLMKFNKENKDFIKPTDKKIKMILKKDKKTNKVRLTLTKVLNFSDENFEKLKELGNRIFERNDDLINFHIDDIIDVGTDSIDDVSTDNTDVGNEES